MDTNFNFLEICQSTSKALGNESKAICKVLEEEKEYVIKMKSYQNLDICILRSEGKHFNFLESFQIHFESMGKCYKGHLERIGEKNKRNYEKNLKVIKILIFSHWDPRVQISSSWTFLKVISSTILGSIARAICKAFEKIKEVVSTFKSFQNVDICSPESKGIKFQIFGEYRDHFKPLGSATRDIRKAFERIKENVRKIKSYNFFHIIPSLELQALEILHISHQ